MRADGETGCVRRLYVFAYRLKTALFTKFFSVFSKAFFHKISGCAADSLFLDKFPASRPL